MNWHKIKKSLTPSETDANLTFKEFRGSINSAEASGYSIRHYPAEIISTALHLALSKPVQESDVIFNFSCSLRV